MFVLGSESMKEMRIIILEQDRGSVVSALQDLGIIDFRRSRLDLEADTPGGYYSEILMLLSKLDYAIGALPQKPIVVHKELPLQQLIDAANRKVGLVDRIEELVERRRLIMSREPSTNYSSYMKEKARLDRELSEISAELDRISNRHYSMLVSLREMLQIAREREEASYFFKRTGSACVIEGWIPAERLNELKRSVNEATKGRCDMHEIRTRELAPTYLSKPEILKPFEYIINLYSVPRSDEINPAWFLMLSFPLFYGLMVSDAGYGLFSLLLAYAISRYAEKDSLVYNMARIWEIASLVTIVFGVFNNEYFGLGLDQYLIPSFTGFDWSHNMSTVVIVSLLLGLSQVSIGLIIGFINNYRRKLMAVAVSKAFLLFLLITGTIAIAGLMFHAFSSAIAYSSIALSLIAMVGLLSLRPNQGGRIIDLIIYPISYIRIMGFGITSILIASLIDRIFLPTLSSGIGVFILYVIVFCTLHFLNMSLSTFEGAIQGIRLNFVEFFEEFYSGGGTKFSPFSFKRRYTRG